MVVQVLDIVDSCDTFEEGAMVRDAIRAELSRDGQATVAFTDVSYATSSFVNGAFVGLLDEYDLDTIKEKLSIIRSHGQINDLVKRMVAHSASKAASQN